MSNDPIQQGRAVPSAPLHPMVTDPVFVEVESSLPAEKTASLGRSSRVTAASVTRLIGHIIQAGQKPAG
jgi:hypothetical protein